MQTKAIFSENLSNFEIPVKSLGEAFDDATEKWKDRTAIKFYGAKQSYWDLREKVNRFATALHDLGVKKGDRVALLLLNCPQFIISFYGAIKIGAIITPISPVYVSSEIKHQLRDSGTETIICQDILYEGVEKTGLKLKNVILTNIAEFLPRMKGFMGKSVLRGVYQKMAIPPSQIFKGKGFYQFKELINKYSPAPPKVEINPKEDLATLPYTGGTTGLSKGVMITHYNIISDHIQFMKFYPVLEEGKETVVAFLPFYHAGGQFCGVINLMLAGQTAVIITNPNPDDILDNIEIERATYFVSAPSMYERLKDHEKTDRVNWRRLKILMSGADTLFEATAKDWEARRGVNIHDIYGMTETVCLTHGSPLGRGRVGSVGIPLPKTEGTVLDPDKDEFVPIGEMGEIAVKGPQITKGYWNNPDETKKCEAIIDGERWWRTGDIGNVDEDDYFHIYDRKRDIIKYKGLRIHAREVEEVLKTHPKIKETAVIGVSDIKVGEMVKAMVVLEMDARGQLSEEEILEYCQGKLAHYKIPKIVEFIGEIPKTDVGKVSRRELREEEL